MANGMKKRMKRVAEVVDQGLQNIENKLEDRTGLLIKKNGKVGPAIGPITSFSNRAAVSETPRFSSKGRQEQTKRNLVRNSQGNDLSNKGGNARVFNPLSPKKKKK